MKRIASAFVALWLAFATGAAAPPVPASGGDSTALSCPRELCVPSVTARVEVGPEPWSVVQSLGSIWVGNDLGVARVDPETDAVEATVPIGGIGDVAAQGGDVWVASYSADTVGRVDPETNAVEDRVHVSDPQGLAIGYGSIWVTSPIRGTLTRIDEHTGTVLAEISIAHPGPGLAGLAVPLAGTVAVGAGAVWAGVENSGRIVRVDPATNKVVATVTAGSYPTIAFAAGSLWVGRDDDQSVRRIDPTTNRVKATIPLHAAPFALSVSAGSVWIAGDGLIARIDPSSNAIVERLLATDGIYSGLTVRGSDVWVARLATEAPLLTYDPDVRLIRMSLSTSSALPVDVTRGVPYTQPVDCGRTSSPSGQCALQADVYSPAHGNDAPVIVLAHGGWCALGCRPYLAGLASVLSLDGAVVFNVDYRDGRDMSNSFQDLACAVRFARKNAPAYGGDPHRVTLVGQSNGSIVGSTVALGGDSFRGGCLARGSGAPDAFVGLSGQPAAGTADYIGRNKNLTFRYVVGGLESHRLADQMESFVKTLRNAGYDARFTVVQGADHFSTFTPGSASPALRIILGAARGP